MKIKECLAKMKNKEKKNEFKAQNTKWTFTAEVYDEICNERTDTVSRIKEALDYENGFENIDIDKLTPMMKIYCETKEQY